jgi:hypothetical protein
MNREKISTQLLAYFLVMMFLMVIGCSSKDDDAIYSISGTVTVYGTGTALEGVTVNLTGAATASTTTDSSGNFSFTNRANGTYTVIPSSSTYTFNPVSAVVVVSGANITATNFVATSTGGADTYSISGTVTGAVQAGVKITLSGTQKGTAETKADGTYIFENLVDGGTYTVTPSYAGYTFKPTSTDVTLSGADVTDTDFRVTVTYTQDDLTGTWNVHMLKTGSDNKWSRGILTFDSSGNLTAASSCLDSAGSTTCPSAGTITWTINANGVISEGGTGAGDDVHMTMTSNKNFIAGTSGAAGGSNAKLMIAQKEVSGTSYATGDVQSKSFVEHLLSVGGSNGWEYGVGTTSAAGEVTISSETNVWNGTTTPGDTGVSMSVDGNGVVTMSAGGGMDNFHGFLSDDKKTIVGTVTETGKTNYRLMIIQITGQTYTAGSLPVGTLDAHMLAAGATPAPFWLHYTNTVASGGVMTASDWVCSNVSVTNPGTTSTASITSSGTVTIDEKPTYHGQVSDDSKFTVGTVTSTTGVYSLQVNTK